VSSLSANTRFSVIGRPRPFSHPFVPRVNHFVHQYTWGIVSKTLLAMSFAQTNNFSSDISAFPLAAAVGPPSSSEQQHQQGDDSLHNLSHKLQLNDRIFGDWTAPPGHVIPTHALPPSRDTGTRKANSSARPPGATTTKPKKARRRFFDASWNCNDCGRNSTPVRRHGPAGPRSLCNACGLRRSKRRRSLQNASTTDSSMIAATSPSGTIGAFANQLGASMFGAGISSTAPMNGFPAGLDTNCLTEVSACKAYPPTAKYMFDTSRMSALPTSTITFNESPISSPHMHSIGVANTNFAVHPSESFPTYSAYQRNPSDLTRSQVGNRLPWSHISTSHEDIDRRNGPGRGQGPPSGSKALQLGVNPFTYERQHIGLPDQITETRPSFVQGNAYRENHTPQDTDFLASRAVYLRSPSGGQGDPSDGQRPLPAVHGFGRQQYSRSEFYNVLHANQTELSSLLDLLPASVQAPADHRVDPQVCFNSRLGPEPSLLSNPGSNCDTQRNYDGIQPDTCAGLNGKW
jgi:hypothetical protein